jgi:hypothetical protein
MAGSSITATMATALGSRAASASHMTWSEVTARICGRSHGPERILYPQRLSGQEGKFGATVSEIRRLCQEERAAVSTHTDI